MISKNSILFFFKWILISVLIGFFSGSASAFFLEALDWVTHFRENHFWIIGFLPLAGLCIGLMYHYYGQEAQKGNNLLLDEYQNPQKTIPIQMAPLVLVTTLLTHLCGGSAGREGTAVQMGGAIADQFSRLSSRAQSRDKLSNSDRKTLLLLGISSGFAAVFGTPLAGAVFALEVLYCREFSFKTIVLSFFVAYTAHFTVGFWQVEHTHYAIETLPKISFSTLSWIVLAGILFGLTALLFSRSCHFWTQLFSKTIAYAPLRPLVGGTLLVALIYFTNVNPYIGLGIPEIVNSFSTPNTSYDFLLKILLTGITLGSGFKGGEVTPLFFVGATLGSALSVIIPLPIALLAGMGFVAVFSGATHSPIACTLMGMELFGLESGLFIALVCWVSYFASGTKGIYSSQIVGGSKQQLYHYIKIKITRWCNSNC